MVSIYRATLIKHGERGEMEPPLAWEDETTTLAQFATDNGFPNPLQVIETKNPLIEDAQVFAAVSGVYPEFLLTVRAFDEWYCVVAWDLMDLFEALYTFRLTLVEEL